MYQALYRKYRPKDFDSVVGQDSIIKTLKNSIINGTFSHAYMFFGPRGTGKTTVSKIFARNVNCLDPRDGIACGKCDSCKSSFSKDCIDIIEIDAASNNGVDEIRELKNKISLVPGELKYKVYIIDEVHMLSIGAFNALLKTLEEPPEHAIFILATTDPQKVPETIVSRCQCFAFKRISPEIIKAKLELVCKEEKIKIESEVLENIALLSDGGMRDALGLLDKLNSYSSKITMDDFVEINGIISNKQLDLFIKEIMTGDIEGVLKDINTFDNSGKNLIQITNQLLNYLRKTIVSYYLENKQLDYSLELIQQLGNIINERMFDIKKSGNTRIYVEMLILKFINDNVSVREDIIKDVVVEKNNSKEEVKEEQQEELDEEFDFSKEFSSEDEVENVGISYKKDNLVSVTFGEKIINIKDIMNVRVNNTLAKADKNLLKEEKNKFDKLKDFSFDQEIGYIVNSLLDSNLRVVSDDNILISFEYESNVDQNLEMLDKMTDVYNKITESNKNIAIVSDKEWDKIKGEYISNIKNKVKYEVLEEPEPVFEEIENNDIISSSAMKLFGDIVEVE